MEKRSSRLTVVIELASRAEEKAAKLFEQKNQQLSEENTRLQELESFYQNYEQQFCTKNTAMRATELFEARQFLSRLSDVQKGQILQIERVKQDLEVAKKQRHQCYLKRKSLNELVTRYKHEESEISDKLEQKQIDEWVTQSHSTH